jgi:hypothetical protein
MTPCPLLASTPLDVSVKLAQRPKVCHSPVIACRVSAASSKASASSLISSVSAELRKSA